MPEYIGLTRNEGTGFQHFTPTEWDWWLTVKAECWAPGNSCSTCVYGETAMCKIFGGDEEEACLICRVFENNCYECRPDSGDCHAAHHFKAAELIDAAIQRLEGEGVWNLKENLPKKKNEQ